MIERYLSLSLAVVTDPREEWQVLTAAVAHTASKTGRVLKQRSAMQEQPDLRSPTYSECHIAPEESEMLSTHIILCEVRGSEAP